MNRAFLAHARGRLIPAFAEPLLGRALIWRRNNRVENYLERSSQRAIAEATVRAKRSPRRGGRPCPTR